MFRTVFSRGLILILVLVLSAPLASAAGSREPEGLSVRGVVTALWEAFVERLPILSLDAASGSSADSTGGSSDPNGGPGMDPNGHPTGP